MIETKLDELIAALNANTEALKAASSAPAAAPATRAPRGSKTTTPATTPEPAKEEAPAPAATPATPAPAPPKADAVTANDLKKFVKDTRTRLSEVSQEAVKKHKEESAKILKSFGLTDFTSIPDDKVEAMMAAFKALNVEKQDDLDDDLDDNDGL